MLIVLVFSYAYTFATPPATKYNAGETLDPTCIPGDTNCTVDTSGLSYTDFSSNSPLSYDNTNGTFSISQSSSTTDGYLSSTDWNIFNNKQDALNGTGFVKISGSTISYDNNTYLTSETDPIFTSWDKSTGISITQSQISDLDLSGYLTSETDPIFSAYSLSGSGTTIALANSPTLSGTISITGDIIPSVNNTYSLGSPTKVWKDIYVGPGSIYVNGQKVLQTDLSDSVVVSADDTQNLILKTTGGGNIELNPASGGGAILLKSNVTLTAGKTIRTSDSSPIIFSDGISTPSITTSVLNGGISITPNGIGNTYITSGNFGIGTTTPTAILQLKAGTATAGTAPLKFTSGTNLATPEAGTMEYNGTNLYFTPSASRKTIAFAEDIVSSPITIVNSTNLFSTVIGAGTGVIATINSNFLGNNAGSYATGATYSNFLGYNAGYQATNALDSNFFGSSAGYQATNAPYSNFFGHNAGYKATSASYSNFSGRSAGYQATNASNSNFFGGNSGSYATYASGSNFFGDNAGNSATNAQNSIFIGQNAGQNDTVNNTSNNLSSILIGSFTNTGGYSNSILLGSGTFSSFISNTKANQFMLAPTITEMRLRGIDYTLPSSQGGANTILTNDGSGGLTWGSVSSSQWTTSGSNIYYNSGNVGIGTNNPQYPLHVFSNSHSVELFRVTGWGTSIGFGADGTGNYWGASIYFNGSRVMTFERGGILVGSNYQSSDAPLNGLAIEGSVGIGTTNPGQKLEINSGHLRFSGLTDSIIQADSNLILQADYGNNNIPGYQDIIFKYRGNEIMRTNGANVGIGTSSPTAKLEVYGTSPTIKVSNGVTGSATLGYNYLSLYSNNLNITTANDGQTTFSSYNFQPFKYSARGYIFNGDYADIGFNASSGTEYFFKLSPKVAQSGTAAYNGIFMNVTQSSVGSGSSYLMNLQADSDSKFAVTPSGTVNVGTLPAYGRLNVDGLVYAQTGFWGYSGNLQLTAPMLAGGSGSGFTIKSNYPADFINFSTGLNSNVMRIIPSGNVGIGTTSPSYSLHVGNSSISGIVARFENSSGTCDINPTTSSLACSSDINLKKNITNLKDNTDYIYNDSIIIDNSNESILYKLNLITPVKYNWNKEDNNNTKHIGFIAQEVEQVFPDLVSTDPDTDLKSISYTNFIPYTISAIQELDLKVKEFEEGDLSVSGSMVSRVKDFLANEFISIRELSVGLFRINGDVCVDDVCITKDEFKEMLLNAKQSSGTSGGTYVPPSDSDDQGSTNSDTSADTSESENSTTDSGMPTDNLDQNANIEDSVKMEESNQNSNTVENSDDSNGLSTQL